MRLRSILLACTLLIVCSSASATGFDWEKAVSLYKQGQFRAAVAEFQSVVAEFPNHSDSWKFIGLSLYQLKEYEQAMPALEKALKLKQAEGKSDPDLLLALSRVQISLKKYDQAIPFLENLAKQRPDLASNRYMLGVAYANVNRNEEAMEAFRTAVKLAPQDADAWQYLSIQLFRLNRAAEAMTALRTGLNVAPKNIEMLSLLGDALLRQAGAETNPVKADALIEESVRVATNLRTARDDAASSELLGRALLAGKKYAPSNSRFNARSPSASSPRPPFTTIWDTRRPSSRNGREPQKVSSRPTALVFRMSTISTTLDLSTKINVATPKPCAPTPGHMRQVAAPMPTLRRVSTELLHSPSRNKTTGERIFERGGSPTHILPFSS
jgi:tetratricopeptide (TPR) repeat protein